MKGLPYLRYSDCLLAISGVAPLPVFYRPSRAYGSTAKSKATLYHKLSGGLHEKNQEKNQPVPQMAEAVTTTGIEQKGRFYREKMHENRSETLK